MKLKKILSGLTLLSVLLTASVYAQNEVSIDVKQAPVSQEKNHFMTVKFAPLGLLISSLDFGVEFKVADHIALGGTILTMDFGDSTDKNERIRSFGASLDAYYYSNSNTQKGTFIKFSPVYSSLKALNSEVSFFALDLVLGKRIQRDLVGFEFGVGPRYKTALGNKIIIDGKDAENIQNTGFGVAILLNLTAAF